MSYPYVYTRHEIFRHEGCRLYSMIGVNIENTDHIAKVGFYADQQSGRFICFSCNQNYEFSYYSYNEIDRKHQKDSKFCSFLSGLDVSISYKPVRPDSEVAVLGIANLTKKRFCGRTIEEWYIRKHNENYDSDNYRIIYRKNVHSLYLKKVETPIEVPPVRDTRRTFNVESFFVVMRVEQNRLDTFRRKRHPFPEEPEFWEKLAKWGFFYTLLNSTIQCAFCRIVLGNVSSHFNIQQIHLQYSTSCRFANNDSSIGNIPRVPVTYTTSPTDNESIQCKICCVNLINITYECGHLFMCSDCADRLPNKLCPTCKQPLNFRRKVFFT